MEATVTIWCGREGEKGDGIIGAIVGGINRRSQSIGSRFSRVGRKACAGRRIRGFLGVGNVKNADACSGVVVAREAAIL
jgi:hypothetical protein